MKIKLIAIGDHMPDWVNEGYEEYAKRLTKPITLELIEIPAKKRVKNADLRRIMEQEGELVLAKIAKDDFVIALDSRGTQWTTEELAKNIEEWQGRGFNISMLIGGPEGLAQACLDRANIKLSLSRLTFPHPLVRIIIAEQLYRALSFLQGHPYHK